MKRLTYARHAAASSFIATASSDAKSGDLPPSESKSTQVASMCSRATRSEDRRRALVVVVCGSFEWRAA